MSTRVLWPPPRWRADRLVLALLAVAIVSGCATTGLVNVWRDPQGPDAPLKNVLVVAIKKDDALRRIMEDAFVTALGQHGVQATPSYRLFPAAVPDTDQVIQAVRDKGYDGVIVASKLATQTSSTYVPGYTVPEARTRFNPWAGRYQTYYVEVYRPGYVETDRIVRHRIDVWSTANGGRLLWTAEGESIDPSSSAQVTKEIAKEVVPAVAKAGILAKSG
jgi:hypothetical protein